MVKNAARKHDASDKLLRERALAALIDFSAGRLLRADARRALSGVLAASPVLHIGDASHAIFGTAAGEIAPWSDADLADLRDRLRQFLLGIVETGRDDDKGSLVPEAALVRSLRFGAIAAGRGVLLAVDGAPLDVLWFQIVMLLQAVGISRVRECPECHAIFVKIGKRDYCTTRCQNTHNQRNHRRQKQIERARRKPRKKRT
jgi:hypothetical protein